MVRKRVEIFICSEDGCNAQFTRPDRFKVHMRTHTGESIFQRPYKCEYKGCGKSYVRSMHLTRHQKKSHPEFVKNLQVSKGKSRKREKIYKCQYCEREFRQKKSKINHESKHENAQLYKCTMENCEVEFPTPWKLRRHIDAHKGHACKKCGAGGFTWSLLRKHVTIAHMEERRCGVCSRVFAKVYNLKKHMKIHCDPSERHKCPVGTCTRSYTEEKNLRYHIESYHSKRPFQCEKLDCGAAFVTESELAKHQKRRHDPKVPLKKRKKKSKNFAAYLCGDIQPIRKKCLPSAATASNPDKEEALTSKGDAQVECEGLQSSDGKDPVQDSDLADISMSPCSLSTKCDEVSPEDTTKYLSSVDENLMSPPSLQEYVSLQFTYEVCS